MDAERKLREESITTFTIQGRDIIDVVSNILTYVGV